MSRVFEKDAVYLMVIISVWKKRFIIKMGLKAKTFFPKTSLENNHKKVVQFQPNDVKHFNVFFFGKNCWSTKKTPLIDVGLIPYIAFSQVS